MTTGDLYSPHQRVTVIEPPAGWRLLNWREMWVYRELLWVLATRDVKVRYKQTVLGAAWAILRPLLTMAIFTIVFGRLAKMPSDGYPYSIFVYAALLPWTFFASAISASGSRSSGRRRSSARSTSHGCSFRSRRSAADSPTCSSRRSFCF